MRKEIMQALQQEYEQQRLKNSQEEMRRRQEVITRCPEIGQYLAERQNLIFGGVRGILNGKAAADDLHLELNIALHRGFQAHDLGHAVVQRQHDDADGVLQLGEAVELVQHDLGVRVLLDLNDDLHAGAARGLVVQIGRASCRERV
mgnify:CR=1 FL=1